MKELELLNTNTELTLEEIGGKGFHLLELIKQNFNIPKTYVIPIGVYRAYIKNQGIDDLISSVFDSGNEKDDFIKKIHAVQDKILNSDLSEELKSQIKKVVGSESYAVRSSGNLEDTTQWSFAGQYDTFLNLKSFEEICLAIKKCWSSIFQEHLFSYLGKSNSLGLPEMAVVIQKLVFSEVSGVLFTLNPQTGDENQMLIESAWGLGEGVVSGIVTPDRFTVDWRTSTVLEEVLSNKRKQVVVNPDGSTREEENPDTITHRASLSKKQIQDLTTIGIAIAKFYGYPQDLEFGIHGDQIFLLQSRAITSFQFDPKIGQWTNANFVEVFPGFHNPLSFSLTGKAFTDTIQDFFIKTKIWRKAPPIEDREQWHAFFFGKCYWKVSAVKDLLVQIPGFNERSFDHTTGVDSRYEGDGRTTGWTPGRIIWGIPVFLSLERHYKTFWKEVEAYNISYFDNEIHLVTKTRRLSSMTDGELEEYVSELFDIHLKTNYYAQYISFLGAQAQDDFHAFLSKINKKKIGQNIISAGNLFTGLQNIKTSLPLIEMNELAEIIRDNPKYTAFVKQTKISEILKNLENTPDLADLKTKIICYLEKYFWMAPTDEDLSSPRWGEDPSFPLTLLKESVVHEPSIHHTIKAQIEIRLKEEEHAKQMLSYGLGKINVIRKKSFWKQVENVRKHIWWREESRAVLSRVYYFVNQAMNELAKRWDQTEILQAPSHLFELSFEQILDFFKKKDQNMIHKKIELYENMKAMYFNFTPPSTIGGVYTKKVINKNSSHSWQGVGCSPGIVRGTVTVISTLDEVAKVSQGDILVVPYTNPGWTPIFSIINGIIMEEGGLLSHGSVVAREYGIPAVLQIEGVVNILKSGDVIEMDGSTGIVTLLKRIST